MSTTIDLDKPRTLHFNLETLGDMEDKLSDGKNLFQCYVGILRRSSNVLIAALWAGLKHEDPTLTISLTRRILQAYLDNGGKIQTVQDALESALKETGMLDRDDELGNVRPEPVET